MPYNKNLESESKFTLHDDIIYNSLYNSNK